MQHALGLLCLVDDAIACSSLGAIRTSPPDAGYEDEIRAVQAFPREHELKLWPVCAGNQESLVVAEPAPGAEAPAVGSVPSYPEPCLPSFRDLDCAGVGANNYTVLPPDPHGFDGDGGRVGCEG